MSGECDTMTCAAPVQNTGAGPGADSLTGSSLHDTLGDGSTDWIGGQGIPRGVRAQIDGPYDTAVVAARPFEARLQALAHLPKTPQNRAEKAELESKRDAAIAEAESNPRAQRTLGRKVTRHQNAESVDDRVFEEELPAAEGRAIVRQNFMGQMTGLFGSEAAVKAWYSGMTRANVPGGPLLHRKAASRLEAAERSFKAEHPDAKFLAHDAAFGMRGLQNTRQGIGMLSHVLGIAVDYKPADSPHIKSAATRDLVAGVTGGTAALEIRGADGAQVPAWEQARTVARIGRATTAGQPLSADDDAFLHDRFDAAFDKLVRSEVELRASLDANGDGADDEVAALRAIGEQYWGVRADVVASGRAVQQGQVRLAAARGAASERIRAKELERINGEIAAARAAVTTAARAQGRKVGATEYDDDAKVIKLRAERAALRKDGPSSALVDADAKVAPLIAQLEAAKQQLIEQRRPFTEQLEVVLAPWIARLDARIAEAEPATEGADPTLIPKEKLLKQLVQRLQKAASRPNSHVAVRAVANTPKYAALLTTLDLTDLSTDELVSQAAAAAAETLDGVQRAGEAMKLVEALRHVKVLLLTDLDFTLGKQSKAVASNPSALQLAERGFVYTGGTLPAPPAQADGQPAGPAPAGPATEGEGQTEYFREFTRSLLKHGFFCGGAWESPDTMHFELADGPDLAAPTAPGTSFGPKGAQQG
jgi:hypothetical protein